MEDSQENGKRKDYKTWSTEESNKLLQLMVDGAKRGLRDVNGVITKQTVEKKLLPKLKEQLGYEISFSQYQSRVKWFKKQYSNYSKLLRHNSGFGWDATTKKFTAPNEVWEDYLKSNPTHGFFRTDTFSDYDDLRIAVGNGTATGMNAIGLGNDTDATILEVEEEDEVDGFESIDKLVFDENTNAFIQTNLASPEPTKSSNIEDQPSSHNSVQGKRSRDDFENRKGKKVSKTQDEVLVNLSSGFERIVKSFDKICGLMEKRESRESDLLDTMKETPGLTDDECFMALDLLNTKAKQDFFLKMTSEQ
ncbi:hypothetical protein DM860_007335 [Cuscuta australis]|uniref:Uncharacterized protein n=1 Tax=Cuscuta australis TaxID=267555 RepID=A0A328E749_9ASTE|nr:hypothetical protein DM860_007335 [Cuscuta australis]